MCVCVCVCLYKGGTPQKTTHNYLLQAGLLVVQASLLRECSRNSLVSVDQLVMLWEAAFSFREFFWKVLSTCLPISGWVIYERTCPHHTECSSVFEQNGMILMPHPPYSPEVTLSNFFLLPWMKNVLKGKCFADVEEVKQNKTRNSRSTQRHQNWEVQKLLWAMEKCFDRRMASNGEYLEVDWSLNM